MIFLTAFHHFIGNDLNVLHVHWPCFIAPNFIRFFYHNTIFEGWNMKACDQSATKENPKDIFLLHIYRMLLCNTHRITLFWIITLFTVELRLFLFRFLFILLSRQQQQPIRGFLLESRLKRTKRETVH